MIIPRKAAVVLFRQLSLAVLAIAAPGAASVAMANAISQDLFFHLDSANLGEVLNFTPFDFSLGTLEGVQISFDATRRNAAGLWNNAPDARSVVYDASLTGTSLTLDGQVFGFADAHYGPDTSPVLGPTTAVGFANEFLAGRAQFLAGLDPVFPSAFQPGTGLSDLTGAYSALGFDGSLDLSYLSGTWTVNANNVFTGSLVDVSGKATVTYLYKPVAVPESPLGLWAPVLWIGLAVVARFRPRAGMAGQRALAFRLRSAVELLDAGI